MRNKPTISYTISKKVNDLLEINKVNKSKLIDHLLEEFFSKKNKIPKEFLK